MSVLRRWFYCCWFIVDCYSRCRSLNCCMFCCMLPFVHSSCAIILMGKRELIALLGLSSWCLVIVVCLFPAVPWFVCGLWLWYFLIILTYYFFSPSPLFALSSDYVFISLSLTNCSKSISSSSLSLFDTGFYKRNTASFNISCCYHISVLSSFFNWVIFVDYKNLSWVWGYDGKICLLSLGWHHEACPVITNGDPKGHIFSILPSHE